MSTETKIKAGFTALAGEVKPDPDAWRRLEKTVGARQRRHVASVLILVLAVAGGGAFAISRSQRPSGFVKPVTPPAWASYANERGWSWTYPSSWTLQPFHEMSRIDWEGALVMNQRRTLVHPTIPNGYTNAWDLRGLPANYVIVQFQHFVGGPQAPDVRPDTVFPLSLDRATSFPSSSSTEPAGASLVVTYHHDSHYELIVWMGPDASASDIEIARRIVASIRFSEPTNSPIANPEAFPTAPSSPVVGTRYYFILYTHCGIKFAYFGNRYWQTTPLNDGNGNPPPGWKNPSDPGTIQLLDRDHAVFEDADGHVLNFSPAPQDTKVPICS